MYRILLVNCCCGFLCVGLVTGCGGSSGGNSTQPTGPILPTISVAPATGSVTSAQPVVVAVTVAGSYGAPSGSVVVSSGSFASFPAPLTNGQASVTVPAGVLPTGTDVLTAAFTPASSAPSEYTAVTGTGSLVVTASSAPPPQVLTTQAFTATAGDPFQAVVLPSGQILVSISQANTGVQVFSPSSSGLKPLCVNSLPANEISEGASGFGLTLFQSNSQVALTISDPGVDFFSTASLTNCQASGAGYNVAQGPPSTKIGSINVAVTADGKYAFVANEYGVAGGATSPGNVGVVALAYDANGNISSGTKLIGQISTGGNSIAGVTLSPDGTRLYATSEIITASAPAAAGSANSILTHGGCMQAAGTNPTRNGLLTVINVAQAEASPSQSAIVATVNSGCSPVRAVESANNDVLYVSSRGDNRVLVFSTGMLEQNADNALLGYADSGGTAPVGLQLFHNQQLLAVANSDRFGTGMPPNATVLSVAAPSAPVLVQTIPTYSFPREFAIAPDDSTLYLTNFDADQLEVITTHVQ